MWAKRVSVSCLLAAGLAGGLQLAGCGSSDSAAGTKGGGKDGGDVTRDGGTGAGGAHGSGGSTGTPDADISTTCAVTQVVAGTGHACALESDGTVWCWGSNSVGQLGTGMRSGSAYKPIKVAALGADVVEIQAGNNQTCARKKDGSLFCWGSDYGNTPIQQTGLSNVASFAVGDGHVCAVMRDGSVGCRGDSTHGELGTGSTVGPVGSITDLGNDVSAVAAGSDHSCALKKDGTLWCWGNNSVGQLGLGDGAPPFECGTGNPCQPSPVQVMSLGTSVKAVVAASAMTCAIKKDGTSW